MSEYRLTTEQELTRLEEYFRASEHSDHAKFKAKVLIKTIRKAQAEIERLSAPPKDLSDPYPIDGPNVREQRRYDSLSEWLKHVEKRLRLVEGVDSTSTGVRWQTVCLGLSERLDTLEEGDYDLLETRLTALSETVARNRKHHNALTKQVTDNAKQPIPTSCAGLLGPNRRVAQRRTGPDDRRNLATRECRYGNKSLGRRYEPNRRQP